MIIFIPRYVYEYFLIGIYAFKTRDAYLLALDVLLLFEYNDINFSQYSQMFTIKCFIIFDWQVFHNLTNDNFAIDITFKIKL